MLGGTLGRKGSLAKPSFRRPCPSKAIGVRPAKLPASRAKRSVSRFHRNVRCAEVSGTSLVEKVSAAELETALQDRSRPIIIDFYATWCGPCILMSTELIKVAEELQDKVRILKVDTDENPQLSSQLKIEGLPTLMFLGTDTAKKALRLEGLITWQQVLKIIKDLD